MDIVALLSLSIRIMKSFENNARCPLTREERTHMRELQKLCTRYEYVQRECGVFAFDLRGVIGEAAQEVGYPSRQRDHFLAHCIRTSFSGASDPEIRRRLEIFFRRVRQKILMGGLRSKEEMGIGYVYPLPKIFQSLGL